MEGIRTLSKKEQNRLGVLNEVAFPCTGYFFPQRRAIPSRMAKRRASGAKDHSVEVVGSSVCDLRFDDLARPGTPFG